MDKKWLSRLAVIVEARHGKEVCERVFGDIYSVEKNHAAKAAWFERFTSGMDDLDDKEFLANMMADNCPCGGGSEREAIKLRENYNKSETLEDFVAMTKFGDKKKLVGNVLYLTKNKTRRKNMGQIAQGCWCELAGHADKYVSDIFCYCCTVGHTGKAFKKAFGDDTRVEFVESLIVGGKGCTVAIHLPVK